MDNDRLIIIVLIFSSPIKNSTAVEAYVESGIELADCLPAESYGNESP